MNTTAYKYPKNMINKFTFLATLCCVIWITALPENAISREPSEQKYLIKTYRIYMHTAKMRESVDFILDQTKKKQGFLLRQRSSSSKEWLQVKIPAHQDYTTILSGLKQYGLIVNQDKNFSNAGEDIVTLRGKIKTLQQYLDSLYSLYKNSGLQQSIEIEKNINATIRKLEHAKGQYRFLIDQTKNVVISIHFSFPKKVKKTTINFGVYWLKNLSISHFIKNF